MALPTPTLVLHAASFSFLAQAAFKTDACAKAASSAKSSVARAVASALAHEALFLQS
jgi:hypothetical protein